MATTTARQTKPTRKGAPEPARRQPAWTGARASPTFSSSNTPLRSANGPPPSNPGSFPPLGQSNGVRQPEISTVLQSLSGLTGTTITLTTKTSQRYEGVIASTSGEGDTTGVTLKDVKEISTPGAPLKDSLFIASTNIDTWISGPAEAKATNGDTFRTDTDISGHAGARPERELLAWQPGASEASGMHGQGDDVTFGPSSNNASWDQFAANEKLFGVKTNFDEDVYTTKLDRSAADFKERERKAQRIANEIIGTTTSNPHIAEERHMNVVDDSGFNEEDKYGAVVRGTNAYVPPGARKTNSNGSIPNAATAAKSEIPKVSVNGPDGASVSQIPQSSPPSTSKTSSPAPANPNKPPADPLPAFRDFVTNEKQRLNQKRQALAKSEMDKRMAELVKFSQDFKLNKPIPDDLVPILAKDEDKQKAIREKSSKDASSTQARTIGATASGGVANQGVARMPPQAPPGKQGAESRKPIAPTGGPVKTTAAPPATSAASRGAPTSKLANPAEPGKAAAVPKSGISMFIQPIPPFKGSKPRPSLGTTAHANAPNGSSQTAIIVPSANANTGQPMSPTTANRLNVNASSFRPNTKASASPNPSVPSASASASVSPKPKPESTSTASNPFFGRPIKKNPPVNIKDDFNPFKHNKVVDSGTVSAIWPYNGKRYMQMFPTPQHPPQQHSPHIAPPGPPPIPPPSYEEDSAQQAAARGYVYAYPSYGYPGQHMMPGMAPPGPPGAYMPGPFMQPMPYPPGMPPNAMYASPGMGQMPPHQAYMPPPPPPGTYPPPPNGAGPRPSMPPTPIPTHAHAYYHQSPQLQHAVPYMMMPPPAPGVPSHPYDGGPAPPVPMGGIGHA